MIELILKFCRLCFREGKKELYPGELGDPINLCPYHRTKENIRDIIRIFIRTRSISIDHFDVWDSNYPIKDFYRYERVCRVCGKRLLKKNGKYSHFLRQHPKCNIFKYNNNWESTRFNLLLDQRKKHECLINLTALDSYYKDSIERWYVLKDNYQLSYLNYCECCNKVISNPEVHHIQPVCTLNESNYNLIWEESNLMILCHECHAKADSHKKIHSKKIQEIKKWIPKTQTKLDIFLN